MLNVTIKTGRLVADPQLRTTQSGKACATFAIAVDRPYQKGDGGRVSDFFSVVTWGMTAEFVCKYFHKGDPISLQGYDTMRSYTDQNGIARKAHEIIAEHVHFVPASSKAPSTGNDVTAAPMATEPEFVEISADEDLPFE